MTISVNKASTISNVEGTRTSHLCKPVINKDTGVVYASATDAAEALGVIPWAVSACCLGKTKTCKGYHLSYVKHASENVDELTAQIRLMQTKMAELEADAAIGRAIREEQEAARKAEEARQKAIDNLKADLDEEKKREQRRQQKVEQLDADLQRAVARLMKTKENIAGMEMKLLELEGSVKA